MAEAFMAYPELRHPFDATPIHPAGSTTVLYQGKAIILNETGDGTGLLITPEQAAEQEQAIGGPPRDFETFAAETARMWAG